MRISGKLLVEISISLILFIFTTVPPQNNVQGFVESRASGVITNNGATVIVRDSLFENNSNAAIRPSGVSSVFCRQISPPLTQLVLSFLFMALLWICLDRLR